MDPERRAEVEAAVGRYRMTPRRAFDALRASGEVPLDVLADGALHHPNPAVRRECVTLLDHVGTGAAGHVFVAALTDPVPRVRRHAAHALGCQVCRPADDPLDVDPAEALAAAAASDPNPKVRAAAAYAAWARSSGSSCSDSNRSNRSAEPATQRRHSGRPST